MVRKYLQYNISASSFIFFLAIW